MTRRTLAIALLLATPMLAADDVVFRAMRDELARSMRKLQLEFCRSRTSSLIAW